MPLHKGSVSGLQPQPACSASAGTGAGPSGGTAASAQPVPHRVPCTPAACQADAGAPGSAETAGAASALSRSGSCTLDFKRGSVSQAARCFIVERRKTWVISRSAGAALGRKSLPCLTLGSPLPASTAHGLSCIGEAPGRCLTEAEQRQGSPQQSSRQLLGQGGAWGQCVAVEEGARAMRLIPHISSWCCAMLLSSDAANIRALM